MKITSLGNRLNNVNNHSLNVLTLNKSIDIDCKCSEKIVKANSKFGINNYHLGKNIDILI